MGVLTYPSEAKTDPDKLACVYNLIEQARLYHNAQGAIAKGDWEANRGKWAAFSQAYHDKVKWLLHEQGRLRDAILAKECPDWAKLTPEQRSDAWVSLFGDKETLKRIPTEATSSVLDELKGITLDSLAALNPPDPTEDFTTYTEEDSAGVLTITSSRITAAALDMDLDAWVYKDKGEGHFDGDFEHLVECYCDDMTANYTSAAIWAVTDYIGDWYDGLSGHSGIYVMFIELNGPLLRLTEIDSGSEHTDEWTGAADDTQYWLKIKRDEAVGTYGTAYCYVYSDSERTNLLDTLQKALHSSKKDFRYVYGMTGCNEPKSNREFYGWSQNLDLQEGGAAAAVVYGFAV